MLSLLHYNSMSHASKHRFSKALIKRKRGKMRSTDTQGRLDTNRKTELQGNFSSQSCRVLVESWELKCSGWCWASWVNFKLEKSSSLMGGSGTTGWKLEPWWNLGNSQVHHLDGIKVFVRRNRCAYNHPCHMHLCWSLVCSSQCWNLPHVEGSVLWFKMRI